MGQSRGAVDENAGGEGDERGGEDQNRTSVDNTHTYKQKEMDVCGIKIDRSFPFSTVISFLSFVSVQAPPFSLPLIDSFLLSCFSRIHQQLIHEREQEQCEIGEGLYELPAMMRPGAAEEAEQRARDRPPAPSEKQIVAAHSITVECAEEAFDVVRHTSNKISIRF